jgi:hypothetical protein|tara:strand:- start:1248 stop:1580 length:333 start_codon:yes stop_codon:yes gene_type:complete
VTRLTTEFWISAYLKRLRLKEIPAFITKKGDKISGAVIIKINTLDGYAASYYKRYNFELDKWHWDMLVSGVDTEVENSLLRQKEIDQDLWVIEVEDRDGRHLLAEDGLSG